MKPKPREYISAHLFYGGNLNLLLKKGVEPFIYEYENKFGKWFFIRYNEDGQHIRLRGLVRESEVEEMKVLILNHFTLFFDKYPSKNTDIPYEKYPDNSIQFIDYEREVERYGASIAVYYFFSKSSKFILQYLEEGTEYENLLIVALLMNLHLVCGFSKGEKKDNSLEKSTKITIEVYSRIYEDWLNYALHYTQLSKEKIEQQFEEIYQQQKEIIDELVKDVLKEHETQTFDEDEFYYWKKPIVGYFSDILNYDYDLTKATQILRDFVHLNNNRLGISNFDEPLLAYLVLRAIK